MQVKSFVAGFLFCAFLVHAWRWCRAWSARCRDRRDLLENIILGYVANSGDGISSSRLRRYVWPDRDGVLPGLSIGEFYCALDRLEEEGRCVSVHELGDDPQHGKPDRIVKLGPVG